MAPLILPVLGPVGFRPDKLKPAAANTLKYLSPEFYNVVKERYKPKEILKLVANLAAYGASEHFITTFAVGVLGAPAVPYVLPAIGALRLMKAASDRRDYLMSQDNFRAKLLGRFGYGTLLYPYDTASRLLNTVFNNVGGLIRGEHFISKIFDKVAKQAKATDADKGIGFSLIDKVLDFGDWITGAGAKAAADDPSVAKAGGGAQKPARATA